MKKTLAKRIILYIVKNEKRRSSFETVIQGIDNECEPIIPNHAKVIQNNKTIGEIQKLLVESGIHCPPDEFYILTVGKGIGGIGPMFDDLKKFLLKKEV